ncbi:hypothetical protein 3 [Wuhan spider virus 5]|uniref:hypothetical protein 3 n=1 Tax=Wuhan spider virus 5 TaxID=1923754 RepID=UPI00090A0F7C|nr:hypothetical protein 3 [Wuhan spider virus 5]APG77421.1 hypothetical protein 3 [Wuhan spider virus 5]
MALVALGAAALAGGISAGATLGASLGAADVQSKTATSINNQNLDFAKQQYSEGLSSFKQAGLPSFLYYSGGNSGLGNLPKTQSHIEGSSFSSSLGVNADLPYYSANPYNQYLQTGRPVPTNKQTQERIPNSNNNTPRSNDIELQDFSSIEPTSRITNSNGNNFQYGGSTSMDNLRAQFAPMLGGNRQSGSGKYSSVPPPASYFTSNRYSQTPPNFGNVSKSSQTSYSSNFGSNSATNNTRSFYSQTNGIFFRSVGFNPLSARGR